MKTGWWTAGVRLLRVGLVVLCLAAGMVVLGQEEPPPPPPGFEPPQEPAGPPVTVRGVVMNAATGQPLRRALVTLTNTDNLGALTDGEGRFEIHGVPAGTETFTVMKPGFDEEVDSSDEQLTPPHVVTVASGMPELSFSLAPKNAIYGHVTLSTGVPALGIGLTLLHQTVVDGRGSWEEVGQHQTTPDGAFRYAGLRDGTYLLMRRPEFDNDRPAEPRCNADAPAEMAGYAAGFYNDAQDLAGAARIVVAGGQNAEVSLALSLTKFHLVKTTVTGIPAGADWEVTHTLMEHGGQDAEYPVHEEKDHSLCAYLPDGSYILAANAALGQEVEWRAQNPPGSKAASREMAGFVEFSVEGKAVRNLRIPLAQRGTTPVHLHYEPAPPAPKKAQALGRGEVEEEEPEPLGLAAIRANVIANNSNARTEATETGGSSYELETVLPGQYWIAANAGQQGVCVGSVTAAGQNLARTPWTAGPSGTGTPIDAVLRTDCAKLTVQMPATLLAADSSEIANLYFYAVPEFDSVEGVTQGQIAQNGAHSAILDDLTPGRYRVFAFRAPRSIEFRNPAALDRLGPGQEVTLGPGSSVNLLLEGITK
jgi:hypothetical protein